MKPIRMIAIDLDDTLIRDDTTVSERTIRTIGAAKAKGIEVVIATGRMYSMARPYGELMQLGDIPMMLFSGALVQTLESKKILYHNPVSLENVQKLVMMAKQNGWVMQTYIDDVLCAPVHNHWVGEYERVTGAHVQIVGDEFYSPKGAASKILAYGEKEEMQNMIQAIEAAFPGVFTLVRSKATFLEIISKGVNKGIGLQRLCDYFKIPAENVMAFGNSQNDLEMLQTAGFSVAVGNAEENLKKAADYVTASNNDDGVAAAIEKFIL